MPSACPPTVCTYVIHRPAISRQTQCCTFCLFATLWICTTHMCCQTGRGVGGLCRRAKHFGESDKYNNGQCCAIMYSQCMSAGHGHVCSSPPRHVGAYTMLHIGSVCYMMDLHHAHVLPDRQAGWPMSPWDTFWPITQSAAGGVVQ